MEHKREEREEGSIVKFKCIYHGKENVSERWFKEGTVMYGQNTSTLVLDCVELRDFGCCERRVSCAGGEDLISSEELDVVPRDGMSECCLTHFSTK